MAFTKSKPKGGIGKSIREDIKAGAKPKDAVAGAVEAARKARAKRK